MALIVETEKRTVRQIEIRIGKEWAKHDFGREVDMATAHKWATHFVDAFCKEESAP